jgi:hypothetical protein
MLEVIPDASQSLHAKLKDFRSLGAEYDGSGD